MTQLIYLLVGVLLGGGAIYLWGRARFATQAGWEDRVKAVTGEALAQSQSSLLEVAQTQLAPIKETLTLFQTQTRELEDKRAREVSAMGERLREVVQGQERLRTETGSLVTALRTPHVRGRWGEVQLRRVVELAGMVEHCDFEVQTTERTTEGNLLRPDMVVRLAGGKSVVVDSKVPIEAYLNAIGTDDPDAKNAQLARHAQQLREHIKKLGHKRYWEQFESSPEFVVMFVDEGLFRAALDQDPTLFDASAEARVVIASPFTLMGLLRTVSYTWQQETVAESAREIQALGQELYKRLGKFATFLAKVGRGLDTAVGAYNDAVSSFETRLLVTARKFPEHGVTTDELTEPKQLEVRARAVEAPELIALPHRDADAA